MKRNIKAVLEPQDLNLGMRDLTVFVITCGEEGLDNCLDSVKKQKLSLGSKPDIQIIRDIYPMSEAFNQMHKRCKTPYFVQVDADVILNEDAIGALYENIQKTGLFTYAVYGQLYEEGFGPGGSVRCWKKAFFNVFKFRDVRTVDRDLFNRLKLFGLRRMKVEGVLGVHKPRQSDFSEYLKTKSDIEKWQFLKRPFMRYADKLYKELTKDPVKNKYKILGFILGTLSSKERIYKSKDMRVEEERLRSLFKILKADFDAFNLKDNTDFVKILNVAKRSYLNYSPKGRSIGEIINSVFGIEADGKMLSELVNIISR